MPFCCRRIVFLEETGGNSACSSHKLSLCVLKACDVNQGSSNISTGQYSGSDFGRHPSFWGRSCSSQSYPKAALAEALQTGAAR